MAEKVLAAVRVAPGKTEIRDYPMPEIAEDAALMKMEVAEFAAPTSNFISIRRPKPT